MKRIHPRELFAFWLGRDWPGRPEGDDRPGDDRPGLGGEDALGKVNDKLLKAT